MRIARYARLMGAAFQAWRELEADAGQPIYLRTGGVSMSPAGVDYVAQVAASLEQIGIPHRRMTGAEWNRAHPGFSVPASSRYRLRARRGNARRRPSRGPPG